MPKPGRVRNYHKEDLRRFYGITPEHYLHLLDSQSGKCAICGYKPEPGKRRLAIDHCHTHKHIRGLLCSECNSALGKFKDSVNILKAAIKYLTKAVKSPILIRRGRG